MGQYKISFVVLGIKAHVEAIALHGTGSSTRRKQNQKRYVDTFAVDKKTVEVDNFESLLQKPPDDRFREACRIANLPTINTVMPSTILIKLYDKVTKT